MQTLTYIGFKYLKDALYWVECSRNLYIPYSKIVGYKFWLFLYQKCLTSLVSLASNRPQNICSLWSISTWDLKRHFRRILFLADWGSSAFFFLGQTCLSSMIYTVHLHVNMHQLKLFKARWDEKQIIKGTCGSLLSATIKILDLVLGIYVLCLIYLCTA